MVEVKEISANGHPEIEKAQERFNDIYSRFSEGTGLISSKDLYQAIIDVNKTKIEFGNLHESERLVREAEIEKISLLIKDINNK